MRKFVSVSPLEESHWFVPMGTVEAIFELLYEYYVQMEDKPAFLYELYMEGVMGVGVTLNDLDVDEFRLFARVMSHIYDGMMIDWQAQFLYDLGVLVLLLSHDPRSGDYELNPVLHKIGPDAYYSIPFAVSRFVWNYLTADLYENKREELADILHHKTLQLNQGFDLTDMNAPLLQAVEDALHRLKRVQRGYNNVGEPMRQQDCDPYIDDLNAVVRSLRGDHESSANT